MGSESMRRPELVMAFQHGRLGECAEGHTRARGHVFGDRGEVEALAGQIEARGWVKGETA